MLLLLETDRWFGVLTGSRLIKLLPVREQMIAEISARAEELGVTFGSFLPMATDLGEAWRILQSRLRVGPKNMVE